MCVIVVKKPKAEVSDEVIEKCWARNGHGGGFIWIPSNDTEEMVVEKGIMTLDEFKKKTAPYRGKAGAFVAHLRIQSKGGVSANLTHPFDFSRDGVKRYLFHNGTARILETSFQQSDSQLLAENLLSHLTDDDALKLLQNLNEKGHGRFVAIIGKKRYVFGDNESKIEDNLWFSNMRHVEHDPKIKINVGDGADDCEYHYGKTRMPRQLPAPKTESTSHIPLDQEKKREIISKAVFGVATCNGTPDTEIQQYCETLKKEFEFENWSDGEILILGNFIQQQNPLLEYFTHKYSK
jgi:predicted glutamine amidotransferase